MRQAYARIFPFIALLLCLCIFETSLAAATTPLDPPMVLHKLQERGVNHGVNITETDGSVVKGRIVSLDATFFRLQPKHGTPLQLSYSQVTAVHGPGLSTGAKIAIGVVAVAGIIVVVAAIKLRNNGFAHNF